MFHLVPARHLLHRAFLLTAAAFLAGGAGSVDGPALPARSPVAAAIPGQAGTLALGEETTAPAPRAAQLQDVYRRLPLSFEANHGQADAAADFLARGRGYSLFLSAGEAVLTLRVPTLQPGTERTASDLADDAVSPARAGAVLRLRLLGASPRSRGGGQEPLPGRVSYMRGSDPARWQRDLPTYARVRYPEVYAGVDLVYHSTQQGELEYDFVLAPGADPGQIALEVQGAAGLALDAAGDLVLTTAAGGEVRQRAPRLYQERNGLRQEVVGGYLLEGQQMRFWVGAYDADLPLVIDPVLVYSSFLGGSGTDGAGGVAVDAEGNVYLAGTTSSPDFPVTPNAGLPIGDTDVFVTKLNPAGTALISSTVLGGSGRDESYALGGDPRLGVDTAGNVYVTGITYSADFPVTLGAVDTTLGGTGDAFVVKLDPSGTALVYSTYLGGGDNDGGAGIAVDAAGNAWVTGSTFSADFPITPGAFDPTLGSGADAFVAKLDPSGALLYATFLGGGGSDTTRVNYDRGYALALDEAGNTYVTGMTAAGDFPVTPGAFDTLLEGDSDAFVAKLDPNGSSLLYATFLGGRGAEHGFAIAVDRAGSAVLTGTTDSPSFPTTPGALDTTCCSTRCFIIKPPNSTCVTLPDAFVTRLDPSGAALVFSTFLGGIDAEVGAGIVVNGAGQVYITGGTSSPDFPTTPGAFDTTFNGGSDAFVAGLDPGGSSLLYATFLGGSGWENSAGIALDSAGYAYLAGRVDSVSAGDFPTTPGAFDTTFNQGLSDAFVVKLPVAPDAIGAQSVRLQVDPGGAVRLSWSPGTEQTGYWIHRIGVPSGSLLLLPPGGTPLPAGATSYTDDTPLSDPMVCYAVVPLSGDEPLARSGLVCAVPGGAMGTAALQAQQFRLERAATGITTFTWTAPASGPPDGYGLVSSVPGDSDHTLTHLPATATEAVVPDTGAASCFTVVAVRDSDSGSPPILCTVPPAAAAPLSANVAVPPPQAP